MVNLVVKTFDNNQSLELNVADDLAGSLFLSVVCQKLNVLEKEYFGLRFFDSNHQPRWILLHKPVKKQIKDSSRVLLFRVKFYPPPEIILGLDQMTGHFLLLQLKCDLICGKLNCPEETKISLKSLALQANFGDFDSHKIVAYEIFFQEINAGRSSTLEFSLIEEYKNLKGMKKFVAESKFNRIASTLPSYGIDPHVARNSIFNHVELVFNHHGVTCIGVDNSVTIHQWETIAKISFVNNMLKLKFHPTDDISVKSYRQSVKFKFMKRISHPDETKNDQKSLVFTFAHNSVCKYAWRCANDQMKFFKCHKNSESTKVTRSGSFRQSRHVFVGRCFKEVCRDYSGARRHYIQSGLETSNPAEAETSKTIKAEVSLAMDDTTVGSVGELLDTDVLVNEEIESISIGSAVDLNEESFIQVTEKIPSNCIPPSEVKNTGFCVRPWNEIFIFLMSFFVIICFYHLMRE